MKRLGAYTGVVAMLVALMTSPFFHFHDRDDHGSPLSVVHAHFDESHVDADDHHGSEIETGPSHHPRWIDFYTLTTPSSPFELGVLNEATLVLPVLEESESVTTSELPRSHGPPGSRLVAPRPPPSI